LNDPRVSGDLAIHDLVLAHYQAFWGPDRVEEVHWTPGHIGQRLPDLHMVTVRPERSGGMWAFATIGAWRGTRESNHNLEFVAAARSQASGVMWNLALIAYYQAGGPEFRLDVGHTVPIGEGWVSGSPLDHVLISLPYLWGPGLENLVAAERHVRVLWALPIYGVEAEYRHRHGLEALEQRFEARRIDVLDPYRRSSVDQLEQL
jgi:hypothetical protein